MTSKTPRKRYRKKRYALPVTVFVVLVLARIALPYAVKSYVNDVLADIPNYYGQVADIDISLLRGAYVIDRLYLNKTDAGSEVPFLKFEKTDISLEWKSLIKGEIVSELILTRPQVIYVFEDQKTNTAEDPEFEDWSKALTDLVPIDINHLQVIDGKVAIIELTAEPTIDLHMNQIQLNATNLRNVLQEGQKLPSDVHATAVSIGNGKVKFDGKMNLVKQIPDLDLGFSLENANVTALNDFTNHYARIDFSEGDFNIFGELVIADGYLKGYIKPLLQNSKLISKEDGFFKTLWEGFVGFFKFVLKNQNNDTLATKIPLEGNLNNVKGKVWPTIFNIIQNGWIKGFKGDIDDTIEFKDVEREADKKKNKD